MKRFFPKSKSNRQLLTLMTGTTVAQAIPIATAPILTRLYTPDNFGVFALYTAISILISVTATGRYELAIVLPKKDSDAANLVLLSIKIAFLVSVITLLLVFFFNKRIASLLGNSEISQWLYFTPLAVLLTGVYQSFNYWSNRKQHYRRLAVSRVTQSTASSLSQLSAGFNGVGSVGLIFGGIIGQALSTVILGGMVWREDKLIFQASSYLKQTALMKRYINFPKYSIVAHLFNNGATQSPVILLNTLFTSTVAGYFTLTNRIIAVPMSIFSSAIADMFRQEASYFFAHNGQCLDLYKRTLKKLVFISFVPFLVFFFISPQLFEFVFGEQWRIAGHYAQILTPRYFLQFIFSPLSAMFLIAEKQKIDLIWQILLFLMVVGSLVIGFFWDSSSLALIIFSAVCTFMYLVNGWLSYRISKGVLT